MLEPHIVPTNKLASPQIHFPIHDQRSEPDIDYEMSVKGSYEIQATIGHGMKERVTYLLRDDHPIENVSL